MELYFQKKGEEYIVEFEALSDFNLHLQRKSKGSLKVCQRGVPTGDYVTSFSKNILDGRPVIDYDFGALVYPKWIKVVSGSEVIVGEVTFA